MKATIEVKHENKYIVENGFITAEQVIEITKVKSSSGAAATLNRLIKAELVVKVRHGRHFYYKRK